MKKITIREIASEAGVSIGTVSNVLHKRQIVSKESAEKVNAVISKYNYRMNISASILRRKISKMIGIIVPDNTNMVYSYISKAIELSASAKGYNVVICNSNYDYHNDIEHIGMLISRNIDGIIIAPTLEKKEVVQGLIDAKIPAVLFNRRIEGIKADCVMSDGYNAIKGAVDYLARLGHKKIGYIGREKNLWHSEFRYKGFIDGLKNNKLELYKEFVINDEGFNFSYYDGYSDMEKFLNKKDKPTAFLIFNDVLAIGAIKAIKDYNYKVPDDFSIIGFDNAMVDDFIDPPLTSITQQKTDMAYKAFEMLFERMQDNSIEQRCTYIPLSLKIRNSTRVIA